MGVQAKYRTVEYLDSFRSNPRDRRTAVEDARRIAEYLKGECPAVVFGIGSAFETGREFGPDSDIDLVVEGIPPERFLSTTAKAALLTRFCVDIIPFETASELVRQRVREDGVRL